MSKAFFVRQWWKRWCVSSSIPKGKTISKWSKWLEIEQLETRLAPAVSLSIATASVIEPGTGGTANMDFTVTRSGDLGSQLTVGYTTVGGTAQPNVDFTPFNGTVTFPYGAATATIGIPVFGTNAYKPGGLNFSVQLTGVVSVVGAPVSMANEVDFSTGTGPVAVAVGDFNGDGKLDVAVANTGDGTVSVLLNDTAPGATTPSFGSAQDFTVGAQPSFLACADINGDGLLDLIVANNNAAGTISVLLNTTAVGAATASFAAHADFTVGDNPTGLAVGDLNGDGKPDVAVANNGSSSVSVLLNSTAPGSATPSFVGHVDFKTGASPYAVAVADLNGDGRADLVVTNGGAASASVLANTTASGAMTASFAAKQDFTTGTNPSALAIGDLNGDGALDLAVANAGDNTVSVLINATAPGSSTFAFAAKQDFATGSDPRGVALKDLNGDGKADLVVADAGTGTDNLSVLVNTTVPGSQIATFAGQQAFTTTGAPTSVAVADFNGDGQPDFASAYPGSGGNGVALLLNTTVLVEASNTSAFTATPIGLTSSQSVVAGDINGDGKPDILALHLGNNYNVSVLINTTVPGSSTPSFAPEKDFLAGAKPWSVILADINGDGKPDIVVSNRVDPTISVLLNTTQPGSLIPTFAPQQVFTAGPSNSEKFVAAADFNGDGKIDLAVSSSNGGVSILLNTTAPGATTVSFAPAKSFATAPGPDGIVAADLNGDGEPDLAIADYTGSVSVLVDTTPAGSLTASFGSELLLGAKGETKSVAAGDLNGDGKPDLVADNIASSTQSVFANTSIPGSSASFAGQQTFPTGQFPARVLLGDMNGDGKPDVIFDNYSNGTEWVLFNTTPPGSPDFSFTTQKIPAVGQVGWDAVADINGDGRPDIVATSQGGAAAVLLNSPATIATASATANLAESAQFAAATETLNENAGAFSITVNLGLTSPVDTTIPFTLGGTAVGGTNYTAVSASPLVIPAGHTTGTITGTLLDNGVFDGDQTLIVTLGKPTNAILGAVPVNTMTIKETSTPPIVSFVSATQVANENDGTFSVTVNLAGVTQALTTIPFTLSGTAAANTNYENVTLSPLVIPSGQSSGTITGTLIDDGEYDTTDKTLIFTLGTPTNATLGTTATDTLTIFEKDPIPTVKFNSAAQTVNENDGTLTAVIKLSAASAVDTTVPFTLGGSAVNGVNYSAVTASPVIIPAGQTSSTITETLLDDGKYDVANKALILALGTPTNALLGAIVQDTITIQETDPPPSVVFGTAAETLSAGAGIFSIPVNLSKVSNAATTIPFTLGGTAVVGTDFSNVTASPLVIPAGQTSGTITGTLIKNQSATNSSTLTFTLGAPTNGSLGGLAANTLINPAPDLTLVLGAPANVTAGTPFIITVTAENAAHNTITGYTGTVHLSSIDPQAVLPADTTLKSGFGFFLATLKTAGIKSVKAADIATVSASIASTITVAPAPATSLAFSNLAATAITGIPLNFTLTALDPYDNVVTGYAGHVHISSSDPVAGLPADATLTNGVGNFSVTLNSLGNQTITALDTVATNPIVGAISSAIITHGLTVTNLTHTATGFTVAFNKLINPSALSLYGNAGTSQDVFLVGKNTNNHEPYPGTVIVDQSSGKTQLTFNVSANYLVASSPGGSAALPDDTYTVTLASGSGGNGLLDSGGQGLDNGSGGHADYVGSFTTTYQHDHTQVLGISDFVRGPNAAGDTNTLVKVPNDPAHGGHVGIPITIYNASNLTSAGFTLTYNANILTVTGGISDPADAAATFTMTSNVMSSDGVHSVATFTFSRATPTSGTQILGDVRAYVPYSALTQYQVKDLLALGNISVNSGANVVPANAVDVNAYFGDVNGDHHVDALDKGSIANVASTLNTGFSAFTLLDPAIIGDLDGDDAVTSNSTSLLSNYLLNFPAAKIPALPNPPIADNLFASPFAADPVLSLPATVKASSGGIVNVPVLLDEPHPKGSTGLVEAELTLKFDPTVLSVSAADVSLGSIPSQGTGWKLSAQVNAATGQITIQLYSQTPIASDQAGSLVNVAFYVKSDTNLSEATTVQLLKSQTVLADSQAAMILSPGLDWTSVLTSDWLQTLN